MQGTEEILYGGLQAYGYFVDHQLEEAACFRFRVGEPHFLSSVDWFVDVFGQHHAKYMFHSQHIDSVYDEA